MAITAVASALLLATAPVAADNWGANGYAGGGPDPGEVACDVTPESECIANDQYHYVYFYAVDSNQYNDTINRMDNVYNPISGIAVWEDLAVHSYTDVIVMDGYFGTSEYAGWTECSDVAAHGSSGRYEWCQPQFIFYNLSRTAYFSTQSRRRMIACHELGHTLGLQHRQVSDSCMHKDANTVVSIPDHEITHLEDLY